MNPEPLLGIVEWVRGSSERWIYREDGSDKVEVEFYRHEPQPAPVHYGCLPGTLNPADGAEVDAIWLTGEASVGQPRREAPTGLLHLADGDHKVLFGALDAEALARLLPWFAGRGARVLGPQAAADFVKGCWVKGCWVKPS